MHLYVGVPCNITRNITVGEESATVTFSSSNSQTTFVCKIDQRESESCKHVVVFDILRTLYYYINIKLYLMCIRTYISTLYVHTYMHISI